MAKKLGIPSISTLNTMLDSVEFVKKAWSSFNLPSSLAPTMDVEELDKRIADLKAVEQWLNVNLSMLRGTIQGLEVQRGTVAAIQAFGRAMTGSNDAMAQLAQAARSAPAPAAMPPPAAAPPASHGGQPPPDGQLTGAPASAVPAAAAPAAPAADPATPPFTPLTLPSGTQMVNPAAWWNLLQGQFNQVAQAAMSGVAQGHAGAAGSKSAAPPAPATARKAARKPAAKAGGARKPATAGRASASRPRGSSS